MSPVPDRARMPQGATAILDARGLPHANRRFAALLRPGMDVLDVGCGTGAITRDAARLAPGGRVVGVDNDAGLVARARRGGGARFVQADVLDLPFRAEFDLVVASRVLQWLPDPVAALQAMARAARPGAIVLVLDYDHHRVEWTPDPGPAARRVYGAFLAWRADAGLDNRIAGRLGDLYAVAGLPAPRVSVQDEVAGAGGDAADGVWIWAIVAASRGHALVADGYLTEAERAAGEAGFRRFAETPGATQALHLRAAEAVVEG